MAQNRVPDPHYESSRAIRHGPARSGTSQYRALAAHTIRTSVDPVRHSHIEGGGHNSGRNGTREIHGSHMSLAHDLLEFVMGDSQHQVIPHDAAAHSPVAEKRQTAEHLPFDEVVPAFQGLANAIREPLVVCHDVR